MTITLVHLSDVHFGCENVGAAEAAIAAAHGLAPDLTIVSGDLTANGRRRQFEKACVWLDRLPRPQIATPGNHDVPYWSLLGRLIAPFKLYREYVGRPDRAAAYLPGLTVRCLNTARGAQLRTDWSKGAIDLAAVKSVAAEMRLATKALKVVVCHHPLIEPTTDTVTGDVSNGAAAAQSLAEAGVDLILSGHAHDPFAIALGGAGRRPQGPPYAIGAGTLSLRTRETRPGFSVIETDADTIKVSALAWTGEKFEPEAVWTLPRRPTPAPTRLLKVIDATNPAPMTK